MWERELCGGGRGQVGWEGKKSGEWEEIEIE